MIRGKIDASFSASINGIQSIALQPDGKILVGGNQSLTRLNVDGSVDTSFTSHKKLNSIVRCITLLPDGKIIIGGGKWNNGFLMRLNADGTIDVSFSVPKIGGVTHIAAQPDGKILAVIQEQRITFLKRFNTDGSIDTSFNTKSFNNHVNGFALLPDGKIIVGREEVSYLYCFDSDGTEDKGFDLVGYPFCLAIQPDGKIFVAGKTRAREEYVEFLERSFEVAPQPFLLQLNTNEKKNILFSPIEYVNCMTPQPDDKIIIGGRNGFLTRLRLNAKDPRDNSFKAPKLNGDVLFLALQADGKLLVGGNFPQKLLRLM